MKTFNEWLKDRAEITEGEMWDTWRPAAWLDGRVPQGWQKKIDQKYARELGGYGGYDAQGNPINSPEQQYNQQQQTQTQPQQQNQPQQQQSYDYHRDGFSGEDIRPNTQSSQMRGEQFDKEIKQAEYDAGRETNPYRKQQLWNKVEQLKKQRAAWMAALQKAAGR